MSEHIKKSLIKTMAEMLHETTDAEWIREELSLMYDVDLDDQLWARLYIQGVVRAAFSK